MGCIRSTHTVLHTHTHTHRSLAVYFSSLLSSRRAHYLHCLTLTREPSSGTESVFLPGFSPACPTFPLAPEALLCSSAASLRLVFVFEHLHLALSTSLPPSLSSPSASTILFIYAKVAADAALSLSSEVYVPLRRLECPFGAACHPVLRSVSDMWNTGAAVSVQLTAGNATTHLPTCCMSHVVFQ